LKPAISHVNPNYPSLWILDPYQPEHLPWDIVERICKLEGSYQAGNRKITRRPELFICLMTGRLQKLTRKDNEIEKVGIALGLEENIWKAKYAHRKLRQLLLEKCQLEAVISMPSGVFKPYAGVSTAVLVFIKGDKTEKVWFYDMEADGYSLDDKRNFIDGKGDIPDIIRDFRKRYEDNPVDRKGKCFFVPVGEIKENGYDLSISKYKEIEYEEVAYEKPEVIMEKIEGLEDQIKNNISELKGMLKQA